MAGSRGGKWEFALCDLSGNELTDLGGVASNRAQAWRRNAIDRLSFECKADDPKVASIHSDGYPLLEAGLRLVKGWRRGPNETTATLKGLWLVWTVLDVGDANDATSVVVCLDLLVRLYRRWALDASVPADPKRVGFTTTDGAQIFKTLVDRTNTTKGPTGVTTTGGTFEATPARTVTYQYRIVGDIGSELGSAFNGFDFTVTPNPASTSASDLAILNCVARQGSTRQNAVFAWGAPPHTVKRMERKTDMETFTNDLLAIGSASSGGQAITSAKFDQPSIDRFSRYQAIDAAFSDISSATFLDALASDELAFRLVRRELVQFTPNPASQATPQPFDDYWLGDLVQTVAGARLRGGFQGYQRVQGIDVMLDDEDRETAVGVYTAEES